MATPVPSEPPSDGTPPEAGPPRAEILRWTAVALACVTASALGIAWWSIDVPETAGSGGGSTVVSSPVPETAAGPGGSDLRGRHLFLRHCAVCHGRWGDGRGEMAVGMRPRPRNFTTGIFKFRSTPSGFLPAPEDLRRTIRNGIANSSMPAFPMLTEDEITAVVGYLRTLSPRWKDPTQSTPERRSGHAPEWFHDPAAAAPHVTAGRVSFVTYCSPCHGPEGDGNGASSSTLEDIWGQPCPPADLRSPIYKSGTEPEDVYRTLSTGMDGTPMPEFHTVMSVEQRWEIVAFLRTLRPSQDNDPESVGK